MGLSNCIIPHMFSPVRLCMGIRVCTYGQSQIALPWVLFTLVFDMGSIIGLKLGSSVTLACQLPQGSTDLGSLGLADISSP